MNFEIMKSYLAIVVISATIVAICQAKCCVEFFNGAKEGSCTGSEEGAGRCFWGWRDCASNGNYLQDHLGFDDNCNRITKTLIGEQNGMLYTTSGKSDLKKYCEYIGGNYQGQEGLSCNQMFRES